MNLLIAYGTTDGMTASISERLAASARAAGHRVTLLNTRANPGALHGEFDAILVGGSLHAHRYQRSMRRFVRDNLATLNSKPSAFFSVCLAEASKLDSERAEGLDIAKKAVTGLGWQPMAVQPIAGALRFSHYGLLRGMVMRKIAKKEDPDVDTSRDHVYTDWSQVDGFLRIFLGLAAKGQSSAVPQPVGSQRIATATV